MRILLIAPEQPGLNVVPEIRNISQMRHVTVLNGPVSTQDIYSACRSSAYDVIHFATHGDESGVYLSNGQHMGMQDIGQAAKVAQATCIFSNTCIGARPASYLVSHGTLFVIYSTINISDAEAWKMPLAFYDALDGGSPASFIDAYLTADMSDGAYGIAVSPQWLKTQLECMDKVKLSTSGSVVITQRQFMAAGAFLFSLLLMITIIVYILAGAAP